MSCIVVVDLDDVDDDDDDDDDMLCDDPWLV